MTDHATDAATRAFVAHRNLLFTVAYEMLGSAADAEDVLQETWMRWVDVDLGVVRDERAYLVRITTRQSLNRLRAMRRRRETYVGSWLPEPLRTAPDVADDVALAESVSMAMMVVLETLSPTERAVFVLREVFDVGYDEIAVGPGQFPYEPDSMWADPHLDEAAALMRSAVDDVAGTRERADRARARVLRDFSPLVSGTFARNRLAGLRAGTPAAVQQATPRSVRASIGDLRRRVRRR